MSRPISEASEGLTQCRPGCGACCVAPSITTPIPGMPRGKPAGVRCAQLTDDNRCRLFGLPERPGFCATLKAAEEMCGRDAREAFVLLTRLERATAPSRRPPAPPARAR